ncbi:MULTISPECIES: hypothetical protein [Bacillus cereus group]|uniref:hypothetical protein n=1 Tax=Bacillus cereus group TaxID=86661 RepID=UPI000279FA83|nr:hypothetical protein [Bacillus cereus]EJR41396.1 hypothetical protein IIE_00412 [Bacillus cereus VD045]HDR4347950.1 hypothetical protein [Bacillus cereus]
MSQQINKEMEALIRGWGLPEYLKEQEGNIDYQFSGLRDANGHEQRYHCLDGNVKFCLYDKVNQKNLFIMDFYKEGKPLFKESRKNEKAIRLQLLYVIDDSLRDKKIASFYVKKLQEYAVDEGMEYIHVEPNADDKLFKNNKVNALSQKKLEQFYDKLSTLKIPIIDISKEKIK